MPISLCKTPNIIIFKIRLGGSVESYPSPEADWAEFERVLKSRLEVTSTVWDPIKKTHQKWINVQKLRPPSGCTIS